MTTAEIAYTVAIAEKETAHGRGASRPERVALGYNVIGMAMKIADLTAERDAALARAERAEAALRLAVRGLERVAALGEGRVYVDLLDVLAEGRAALAKHPAP